MTTTERSTVDQVLDDRTYHIEFNSDPDLNGPAFPACRSLPSARHLSNNAKHAVVALADLGASAKRIKEFYDSYAVLTPHGYPLEPAKVADQVITDENWERFIGKRVNYAGFRDFFDRRERELGTEELLRRYAPPLLSGWLGAFGHPTVHLGLGLAAGNRWMTVEGLAYLAFAHVSCHPERSSPVARPGEASAVESLLRIAEEWHGDPPHQWVETLIADTTSDVARRIHPDLAGRQYRIASLLGAGHPLIHRTPTWIEDGEPATSWGRLHYAATLLYLAVPGDPLLLHLITSVHAMERIAARLPRDQQRHAVRCYWIGALCLLFSRADFPRRAALAELHARFADAVDREDEAWDRLAARAVEQAEQHHPELVYVMRDAWRRSGHRAIYRVAAGRSAPLTEAIMP
ncbi:questin oxidase family protein [Saccharothrix obliqua]|uniref:questin oxidase family protein n=1 Tax=Saccharothrix obliqua TaxID=2861747 RepID=UPI001C5E9F42|nr:questin oxidase family protein [Saccharothrix obliqua]MBW4718718.1 questin oxidase family protein [Saccharothrix obliqua]